ncbi:hypothetical protein [Asticcacaulis sp.]|uniref:hypothetical protein n=1 Tax=Asticcacaulis sp. TaxID=1872648 RepID=UPI002B9612C6|nr:hypothetical protein [Asticcacaulis sp.]HTM81220.1 hypothetical protein [Asticcacaulis sp.]
MPDELRPMKLRMAINLTIASNLKWEYGDTKDKKSKRTILVDAGAYSIVSVMIFCRGGL